MATEIKLPALSESVNEGGVSEVRVKAGDAVKVGDTLLVVEAEKCTLEIPSDVAGTITEVLVKKGDTVKAGQTLFRVEAGAAKPDGKAPEPAAAKKATPAETTEPARKPTAAVAKKPAATA